MLSSTDSTWKFIKKKKQKLSDIYKRKKNDGREKRECFFFKL